MPQRYNFNLFSNYISQLDYFKKPIGFTISKNFRLPDFLGFIFSILLYLLFIFLVFIFGKQSLNKQPNVLKSTVVLDVLPQIDCKSDSNLYIALKLTSNGNSIPIENFLIKFENLEYVSHNKIGIQNFEMSLNSHNYSDFYFFKLSNYNPQDIQNNKNFGFLKLFFSNNKNLTDEIIINAYLPVINFNPYNKTKPFVREYKLIKDIYKNKFMSTREITCSEYILKDDQGFFLNSEFIFNSLGISDSHSYVEFDDVGIYTLSLFNSKKIIEYSRIYPKIQEIIPQSFCLIYLIFTIINFLVQIPLHGINKLYIAGRITEVEEKEDSKIKNEYRHLTNYQIELKNLIEKIRRFKLFKSSKMRDPRLKNLPKIYELEREVSELSGQENRMNESYSNNKMEPETINVKSNSQTLTKSNIENKDNSILKPNRVANHSLFVTEKQLSSPPKNFINKEPINDVVNSTLDKSKIRRRSVDLLSVQIHACRNTKNNYEINDSNTIPLNVIECKLKNDFVFNVDNKIVESNKNSINDMNRSESKFEYKANSINYIHDKSPYKNNKVKFDFSVKEILKKYFCLYNLKTRDKVKLTLYNMIDHYVENKLEITSYFNLLNEARVLKSLFLTTEQQFAINNINYPTLFYKCTNGNSNTDKSYYSKINTEILENCYNYSESKEYIKDINLMSEYFAKNILNEKMSHPDYVLLNSMNEECLMSIVKKVNELKESLIN